MRKNWFENYCGIDAKQVTCAGNRTLRTAGKGLRSISSVTHIPILCANPFFNYCHS